MDSQETEIAVITEEEEGGRIDAILAARYKDIKSRTYFQQLISEHKVLVNGQPVKKRSRLSKDDEVEIFFSLTPEIDLEPEDIPLSILFEDSHLLVVNKPAGLVVHPAPGNWSGTFVNALLYHCKALESVEGNLRPGIVHRLDKDTSGLLVAAKTSYCQQRLIELFSKRAVKKQYAAICIGNPGEGKFHWPIGRHPIHRKKMAVVEEKGREAVTSYRTLLYDGQLSVVHVEIETGRTHQIRVHFSHHRTPVLGDPLYGNARQNALYKAGRQLLHAKMLSFIHPITGENLTVEAPLPEDMALVEQLIRKGNRL